jgi:hypothetical protein
MGKGVRIQAREFKSKVTKDKGFENIEKNALCETPINITSKLDVTLVFRIRILAY